MPPHPRVPQPPPDLPAGYHENLKRSLEVPDFAKLSEGLSDPSAWEALARRMFALGMRYGAATCTGGYEEQVEEEATLIENGGKP